MAVLWIALMLVYLLGDVLRVYEKGQGAAVIDGKPMDQTMFLLAAAMMLIPILMSIVSVFAAYPIARWGGIILSIAMFALNAAGVKTYAWPFDRMLIIVSLALNVATVWAAWSWQGA